VELKVVDGIVTDVRYNGRGCAISQASASMLSDVVMGKPLDQLAGISKEDVLEELGIPLSPIRLKCAMLSVGVLKVALSQLTGDPLPEEWAGSDEITWKSA
jgi:nitrogen fixation NifU-like protein